MGRWFLMVVLPSLLVLTSACGSSQQPVTAQQGQGMMHGQAIDPELQARIDAGDPEAVLGSDPGLLRVESRPRGEVIVDGEPTGQWTPVERLEVRPGNREIRVRFENGQFSETRTIFARPQTPTRVFFRERGADDGSTSWLLD